MVLKGIHLFLIMIVFVVVIGGVVVFFYRNKFSLVSRLSKELGFTAYLGEKNVPPEITKLGENILEFGQFEWVLSGEMQGKKIYIAQYFLSRRSLYPFRFVAFTIFDSERSGKLEQEGDLLITKSGVFYYRGTPFEWKKETLFPILENLIRVRLKRE